MTIYCPSCRRVLGELIAGQFVTVHSSVEQISTLPVYLRCRCKNHVIISGGEVVRYNVIVAVRELGPNSPETAQESNTVGLRADPTPQHMPER